MKLLSLGAIAMDVVLNSHELPKDDGFALINHEEMLPGGSASNVSVSAAHLGLDVYQTGKIGDDNIGDEFRRTLVEDGVDDRYVVTKKGGTTYIYFNCTGRETLHLCEYGRYSMYIDAGGAAGRYYGRDGYFL